jgi:hypothetical protein
MRNWTLKALLAECVEQNTGQARVLKQIQSLLPQTFQEMLDSFEAEMAHDAELDRLLNNSLSPVSPFL